MEERPVGGDSFKFHANIFMGGGFDTSMARFHDFHDLILYLHETKKNLQEYKAHCVPVFVFRHTRTSQV